MGDRRKRTLGNESHMKEVIRLIKTNEFDRVLTIVRKSHRDLEELIPLVLVVACKKARFIDAFVMLRTLEEIALREKYHPVELYDFAMAAVNFPPGCKASWVMNIMERLRELVAWPTVEHYDRSKIVLGITANYYGDAEKTMKHVRLPRGNDSEDTLVDIKPEIIDIQDLRSPGKSKYTSVITFAGIGSLDGRGERHGISIHASKTVVINNKEERVTVDAGSSGDAPQNPSVRYGGQIILGTIKAVPLSITPNGAVFFPAGGVPKDLWNEIQSPIKMPMRVDLAVASVNLERGGITMGKILGSKIENNDHRSLYDHPKMGLSSLHWERPFDKGEDVGETTY